MKKTIKIIAFSLLFVFLAGMTGLGVFIGSSYYKASKEKLDIEKLTSPSVAVSIFDSENKAIKEENNLNGKYAKAAALNNNTLNAFISIEDKVFYKHNGVNYKRIAKAMANNLKSGKLKEGASTISQQLIKNTHLTSEKTFNRKIKEVALTRKLEKEFSKEQILEQYLNAIYFGNNCYGIESAAGYYFSKPAHDLTLDESALLAGIIKSPYKYSPLLHPEECLKRRNLVLSEMEKDGAITFQESMMAKNTPIKLEINTNKANKLNCYSQASIDEAKKILNLPAKQIALSGYKIYTYLDPEKQEALKNSFNSVLECDNAGVVIDNKRHAIVAYHGNSNYNILDAKRQPGSCIKPLIVYGPALNEDIIYPYTQLLDEKTTISGYNPKNVGDLYRGYVSAEDALAKSINIPAVKVLSYLGIDKGKAYCEKMGLSFDEKDDSYALALGGMTYGTNVVELAGAFSTFANTGKFASPRFISYITDKNNKIVYIHKPNEEQVFREDSAYLVTNMLKTCVKEGTAKKLSQLNLDLASKTGTVGKPKSKKNTDAWNITFSNDYTVGVWLGNLDNKPINYAGGNQPTCTVKNYFQQVGDNSNFACPSSIVEMPIDLTELNENHRIVLANPFTPERYTSPKLFSRLNLPKDISTKFTKIEKPNCSIKINGSKGLLTIDCKSYMKYNIYLEEENRERLIGEISEKSGVQSITFNLIKNKGRIIIASSYIGSEISEKTEIDVVKSIKKQQKDKWYI